MVRGHRPARKSVPTPLPRCSWLPLSHPAETCRCRLVAIRKLAGEVGMGVTALVEHLYNVDLINDAEREQLRQF